MTRPVFGQGYPPLEMTYSLDRPCRNGQHLLGDWQRCTECGYFMDDLCPVPKCREVTRGGLCLEHELKVQPEGRA